MQLYIACKKLWTSSVDQGRLIYCKGGFARGQTQLHMQMCPGGHNSIMQQRPGGHDCICKTVRRTWLQMQSYVLRACMHWTNMQHEYSRILWLQRILNGRTFPMSFMTCTYLYLACKKWRTSSIDQGHLIYCKDRFARGQTQLHMQMCPGGHNCIMQHRPGRHNCIFKIVRRTLLHICNNAFG